MFHIEFFKMIRKQHERSNKNYNNKIYYKYVIEKTNKQFTHF